MGFTLVRRWRTETDEGEEVLWPKASAERKHATHNEFGRRYTRHREKHANYFEAIAHRVVADRHVTVDLGPVTLDVRLSRFGRWLDIGTLGGYPWMHTSVKGHNGEDLVGVIADYLMMTAANYPGVQVPSDGDSRG